MSTHQNNNVVPLHHHEKKKAHRVHRKGLTIKELNALKPRAKPYEVWDGGEKGLFLRVLPSGRKSWLVLYDAKLASRITVGHYDGTDDPRAKRLLPEEARRVARDTLSMYETDNLDPIVERRRKRLERGDQKRIQREQKEKQNEELVLKDRTRKTLGEFIEERFMDRMKLKTKNRGDEKARLLSGFANLMRTPLSSITSDVIADWVQKRRDEGRANATILRKLAYMKPVMKLARKEGLTQLNPFEDFQLDAPEPNRVRYLDAEEERRLYKALRDREAAIRLHRARHRRWLLERMSGRHKEENDRKLKDLPSIHKDDFADHILPLVILAQHTGMRRGELFGLRWAAVNFKLKLATVRGETAKTGVTRHIPLDEDALATLTRWQKQSKHTEANDLVFPSEAGERLDNIASAWETVRQRAKLTDFRFHDLRHDFASKLVMANEALNTVRELMGHTTLAMTLRYAHLSTPHLAEAVAKLPRIPA